MILNSQLTSWYKKKIKKKKKIGKQLGFPQAIPTFFPAQIMDLVKTFVELKQWGDMQKNVGPDIQKIFPQRN